MAFPLKHKELSYHYKCFGLAVQSNSLLPGIPLDERASEARTLALHLGVAPYTEPRNKLGPEQLTYVSSDTNDKGDPVLRISRVKQGAFVRMAYEDGTEFWLDQGLENVWATWPERLPVENAISYLLGPVFGLLLRLRGVVCLHASAVSIEGRAVAFVGPPGAGKSTTAAACSKMGHSVLSDDIVAMEERQGCFYALAAHPQLRLWPESVKLLYGCAEALPRFNPECDKRGLRPGDLGTQFEDRALPLRAIYVLGDRRSDLTPFVERLGPKAALLSLLPGSYGNSILDREMRAREFEVLGRLVSTVSVRQVHAPDDANRLEDLCRIICEDLVRLDLPPAVPSSAQATGTIGY